jgi:hypothetical protein
VFQVCNLNFEITNPSHTSEGVFVMNWFRRSVTARSFRRMVFGLAAVGGVLWFADQVQRISSQRGIETTRATGLSAYSMRFGLSKAAILGKAVLPQMSLAQAPVFPPGTRIARTASLRIFVRDFLAAQESVDRTVKSRGGFAAAMTVSSPIGSSRSLSADIEIPSAQCDATLREFRMLGRVEEERQGSEEVGAQSEDLDIRLRNSRETENRLTDILRVGTGKVSDVLEVENEITRVRGEIEEHEAEQKRLANRISFAAIELDLTEEFPERAGIRLARIGLRMKNALIEGYQGAADGFFDVLEIVLTAAPSLFVWGLLLFWPIRWGWRRWRTIKAESGAQA